MGIKSRGNAEALPESASVLLDVLRFSAAVAVVIDHLTLPLFRLGYEDREILGYIAVPVFFVLSGFVIRYVTRTREVTSREYFIDRASRIYSVVLPAMAFSLVAGGLCFLINREWFMREWASTFTHPGLRILLNLTFVSQAWGHNTIPFLSMPFWSLGYECVYYVMYGFMCFFRGWKRLIPMLLLALAIGPQVMLLFPVWWLGCWVYDLYVLWRGRRISRVILWVCGGWIVAGGMSALAGYRSLLAAPVRAFQAIASLPNPIERIGMSPMRATMFAVATGVLSSVALLVLLFAMDYLHLSRENRWARGFREIANGTFSLYMLHYPFFVLLLFAGVLRPGHFVENALVSLGMIVLLWQRQCLWTP